MSPPHDPSAHSARSATAPRRHTLFLALCAVVVCCGFFALASYSRRAGTPSEPPARLAPVSAAPELLAFFHPRCPCSRATIAQLAHVVERAARSVHVRAFVLDDPAAGLAAHDSPNWNHLAALRDIEIVADPLGATARAHGVATSGALLFYGTNGELLFDGGITAARGHVGPNSAEDALLARIASDAGPLAVAPVFGCALHSAPATAGTTP